MATELMKYSLVEFPSQGSVIRGKLYFPENIVNPYSFIIVAHGFTATINGMVARHTLLVEHAVINLLKARKNQIKTAKLMRSGFNVVDRIMHLSVDAEKIGYPMMR